MVIEREHVGCAYGSILVGNILGFVSKVWKVEAFVFRSLNHLLKTILWIVVIIVAVYRDESHAVCGIVSLELDHPVLVVPDIRTVIATEGNNQRLTSRKVLQTVRAAVYALQMKIDS